MIKTIKITIVLALFLPLKTGEAQINSDTISRNEIITLTKEVDSLRQQVRLNLDIIEYRIDNTIKNQEDEDNN